MQVVGAVACQCADQRNDLQLLVERQEARGTRQAEVSRGEGAYASEHGCCSQRVLLSIGLQRLDQVVTWQKPQRVRSHRGRHGHRERGRATAADQTEGKVTRDLQTTKDSSLKTLKFSLGSYIVSCFQIMQRTRIATTS